MIPMMIIAYTQRTRNIKLFAASAGLVVVGVLSMRYNLVIGGQTIPKTGSGLIEYIPTAREIGIVAGLFFIGIALMLMALKFLPLDKPAAAYTAEHKKA